MIYREYGKTGKQLSLLSFGGMRFSNIDNHDDCVQMMVEAAEGGINYFDTAPQYFGIKSEQVFGKGLAELRRRGLPYYSATKTFSADEKIIRQELEAQLKRLQVDCIDFYYVWCLIHLDDWRGRRKKGVVEVFRKLKEEGLIRHICVSHHLPGDQVKEVLEEDEFEGVLFGYSAANFAYREETFAAIAERKLGAVVMNPLAGGVIPRHPELFKFVQTQPDETVSQAALRFLFAHQDITSVLVGFANSAEVKEGLEAVKGFQEITPARLAELKLGINEAFRDLCTGCRYCDNCPEGIPVPRLMDAYNHLLLGDGKYAMFDRLKWHWTTSPDEAAKCTECGECEDACTQHLPIIGRLGKMAELAQARNRKGKKS